MKTIVEDTKLSRGPWTVLLRESDDGPDGRSYFDFFDIEHETLGAFSETDEKETFGIDSHVVALGQSLVYEGAPYRPGVARQIAKAWLILATSV